MTELIPPSPVVSGPSAAAPCDAIQLYISASTTQEVRLEEELLPFLSRDAGSIWVQVPCTAVPTDRPRPLILANASPFGTGMAVTIRHVAPAFLAIAHQDFSGPVDWESPAQIGETVHLWGTGYGVRGSARWTGLSARESPARPRRSPD